METGRAIASALSRVLAEQPGIASAYLFGSVAEDRAHRESDADLGVLLAYEAYPRAADRFDARLLLISRLTAAVKCEVDVVILNDAPPQLARHIMTKGRRVFVADAAADHACLRTALSRAADLEPFLRRARRVKLTALSR